MALVVSMPVTPPPEVKLDHSAVLAAIPDAVLVVDASDTILLANPAAESFFEAGASLLIGKALTEFIPDDNPVFGVLHQARKHGASVSEEEVAIETPRIGHQLVSVRAGYVGEGGEGQIALVLQRRTIARTIGRQLVHRNTARSVGAMAQMLAHEVKNPLSGIRGAAQLLEQNRAAAGPRTHAPDLRRVRSHSCTGRPDGDFLRRPAVRGGPGEHPSRTRPCAHAGAGRLRQACPLRRELRSVAAAGAGQPQSADPDFPESCEERGRGRSRQGGEIVLSTAFQQGVRFAVPGTNQRVSLPLVVSVQDNGEGIPEDVRAHLFEPFITTKKQGTGLGLALVAKIVGDHGGVIEFDGQPRRTIFRVRLPIASGAAVE